MEKKICFVHYGIGWRDGINTVIKTSVAQIRKKRPLFEIHFVGGEVKGCEFPHRIHELLPTERKIIKRNIEKQSVVIAEKLAKETKGMDVVVIENPFLGTYHLAAMIGFALYAKKYKPKGTKIFFRVHDLFSDAPQYNDLDRYLSHSQLRKILGAKGVDGIFIVNRELKKKLVKAGVPLKKIIYLPNGINESLFDRKLSRVAKKKILERIRPGLSDRKAKVLVYPVRVVPRKNIEEAILLTSFIREITGDDYILVISGKVDDSDPLSRNYYKKLKKLEKAVDFPVIFPDKTFSLEAKEGFSIGDLYAMSSAIVMTSFREGFGYPFLECWFARKIVIGRRIDNVIKDFEKGGMNFEWLYHTFVFPKKDLLKVAKEELIEGPNKVLEAIKNPELKEKIFKANKVNIMKQVVLLQDKIKRDKIIKYNLEKARNNYGDKKITEKLLKYLA